MIVLSWNCQGIGTPWTVHSLREMVRSLNPELVFLMETKCNSYRIETIKRTLDMNGLAVDSIGRSGGLALLWKKSVNVVIQSYSNRHIDALIQSNTDAPTWRFCGFYGEPKISQRKKTWDLLTRLKAQSIRPWLCMVEFNEILDNSEKESASNRKRSNQIRRLRDEDNRVFDDKEGIQTLIEQYFGEIFDSCHPCPEDVERGTRFVSIKVDDGMNQSLLQPYTEEEIRKAVFQMAPFKSPGPDGMPPIFYQFYWNNIKSDVISFVLKFLNNHTLDTSMNKTQIVLIPKCKNPEKLSQFRPISLCNVIYKIASKTIANRLKPLLDHIISQNQSAFVLGCLISDNILIAFEINHFLRTRNGGNKCHAAIKLDISKAEFGSLSPSRGLRQGDPLSPYLFLLCTEAFSSLIQNAEQAGEIKGISICRRAPSISHLLFADDTQIYCQATHSSIIFVKNILETYAKASGQMINYNKSSMVLSKNSTDTLKDTLPTLLGLQREDQQERYPGLPSVVGRSKKGVFSYIGDRVWQRIKGWCERNLSQAGKATMIQSVLQAIPMFAMSVFKLPDSLIAEIQGMSSNFFWHNKEKRKIHWINWSRLCYRKCDGGLGFCSLKAFNLAMLAKQLWLLLMKPQCLLSQVLKARYYPSSSPLEAKVGYRPSLTWRSIINSKEIIAAGSRWSVGSGSSIKIWKDPWLPRPVTFKPITPPPEGHDQNVVAAMIDPETKEWDRQIIENIFNPEDQELILKIPLGRESLPDTRCWHYTQNGLFTVRSAYFLAVKSLNPQSSSTRSNDPLNARWKTIWNVKLPPKVRLFVWKLASNALPTGTNLEKRLRTIHFACPFCGDTNDDTLHIFLHCHYARQTWALADLPWTTISAWRGDTLEWITNVSSLLTIHDFEKFLVNC
ncbi:UNVERIFIED_CONTAM: putative mitochondrial protein [Sesamum radiatum]|uniref:Mitochondrial protein n=1 Tax=Sesamum radiatum TaxID=300843 RepID=A0AAW2K5C0_SESRA